MRPRLINGPSARAFDLFGENLPSLSHSLIRQGDWVEVIHGVTGLGKPRP